MNLTVAQGELLAALSLASKAIDARNSVPILGYALLSADGASMGVSATDLEVATCQEMPVRCAVGGDIALPVKPLIAFVKSLPKGAEVSIETDDDDTEATFRAGGREAKFQSLPAEDFPSVSQFEAQSFQIGAAELDRLIRMVRPAISTEETRYYLNGIFLHAAEDGGKKLLRSVAVDGHRLMVAEMDAPAGVEPAWFPGHGDQRGYIVPRGSLPAIQELLGRKPSGLVEVLVGDMRLGFRVGSRQVLTKVVDGSFPDYQRIIPRHNEHKLTVDAAECAKLAKSLADSVSKDTTRAVKFELGQGHVSLSSFDQEGGTARAGLNGITAYTGPDMQIGFQARYVRDMLSVLDGAADIAISDAASPVVVTAHSDPRWTGVIMPMRV